MEGLSVTEVAAVVGSCDRSQPAGRRDYAILILLARLGLRSGEVAAIRFGDINWRCGEICVRGKARRQDYLPIPIEVGEAIVDYLTQGRPPCECRQIFVTAYAPRRPIHPSSITRVVYRACRRAGLPPVGGHRLRHGLATEILSRGGDLVEIGQVLRQSDLATTSGYAKIDRTPMRAATFQSLIGVLATTGMRIGEAIAVDRADVDLCEGVIVVRSSKFDKSRELPLHSSTVDALASYAQIRDRPQLQQMLAYVAENPVDYLIVHKIDRLALADAQTTYDDTIRRFSV